MQAAEISSHVAERLATLRNLGILDTPVGPGYHLKVTERDGLKLAKTLL